jgi:hypothetical protein
VLAVPLLKTHQGNSSNPIQTAEGLRERNVFIAATIETVTLTYDQKNACAIVSPLQGRRRDHYRKICHHFHWVGCRGWVLALPDLRVHRLWDGF